MSLTNFGRRPLFADVRRRFVMPGGSTMPTSSRPSFSKSTHESIRARTAGTKLYMIRNGKFVAEKP